MTKIFDKLHDVVFEPSASNPANPILPTPQIPQAVFDTLNQHAQAMEAATGVPTVGGPIYDHLLQITDRTKFAALATFYAMCKKLEPAIPDRSTRMKAALATSDVTVDILVNNVQAMKQALKQEVESGHQKLSGNFDTANDEVHHLEDQLNTAREKLSQITSAKTALTSANAQRFSELDQMEKEIARLR